MIVSVSKEINVWDTNSGLKLGSLPDLPQIPKEKYIGRSARFVNLNPKSTRSFLVVAHNMRQCTSKSNCFISVWAFHREEKQFKNLELHEIKKEVS